MNDPKIVEKALIHTLIAINLTTLLIIALNFSALSIIILFNIICGNIAASLCIYAFYDSRLRKERMNKEKSESQNAPQETSKDRLTIIQKYIDQQDYATALKLIGDYAMEDYRDLIEEKHLPYVIAVILGRYRKTCLMEDIDFHIQTEDPFTVNHLKMNYAVNIIGNLIDNAIDEVKDIKGERFIGITIGTVNQDQMRITVTNSYKRKIDVNKIFKPGYTTKKAANHGKRGFGLSLVSELVQEQGGNLLVTQSDYITFEVII